MGKIQAGHLLQDALIATAHGAKPTFWMSRRRPIMIFRHNGGLKAQVAGAAP
jgi:hypothetical protein